MMSLPSRPPLESKDSSFDDPLTINPWKVLVDNICENLDKELYSKFLFHSKELVLDDYNALEKNGERDEYRQYFSKLEDNLGENGAVDHLEHLVRHLGLHGGMGEINYTEWISSYKEAKIEYIRKCESVLKIDPDFIGRELILEDTLKNFRAFKGVTLCGISGMGKTSLAAQVCARLACSKPKWRIIILNQREKSELNDLLLDMISELSAELDGNEYMQLLSETNTNHLKIRCNKLIDEVLEKQLNILLLLDNVDGHCDGEDRQHDFSQFMKELLNNIPLKSS
ncbi:uncharacterized protein LOC132752306, partial [Ruditapes philippinarum]|uniref:uncharacterized protein LOC132752306 n=1 Tax=Ruditapes philippinarum TaxID=129788 RepID=UPI00295A69B0